MQKRGDGIMITVNKMKPSERMKIPRQVSIEQKPDERSHNFKEVSFGVDEERALIEAARCLECQNPVCREGCPVNIDIRSFIQLVYQKDFSGAVNVGAYARRKNNVNRSAHLEKNMNLLQ
jgi:ferredoxin